MASRAHHRYHPDEASAAPLGRRAWCRALQRHLWQQVPQQQDGARASHDAGPCLEPMRRGYCQDARPLADAPCRAWLLDRRQWPDAARDVAPHCEGFPGGYCRLVPVSQKPGAADRRNPDEQRYLDEERSLDEAPVRPLRVARRLALAAESPEAVPHWVPPQGWPWVRAMPPGRPVRNEPAPTGHQLWLPERQQNEPAPTGHQLWLPERESPGRASWQRVQASWAWAPGRTCLGRLQGQPGQLGWLVPFG